jgi:hypothetical protein
MNGDGMGASILNRRAFSLAAIALAGVSASRTYATNWCPTPSDYVVSCNNCTREITCVSNNTSILISGTNVTIDGQGLSMGNSPSTGITVTKPGAVIKNYEVYQPHGNGIHFKSNVAGGQNYTFKLENVEVWLATGDGVVNESNSPLQITGGTMAYNTGSGIVSKGLGSASYTSLESNLSMNNGYAGFHDVVGNNWANNSSMNGNRYGVISYGSGVDFYNNNVSGNTSHGMYVISGSGYLLSNTGNGNGGYDCKDISSGGLLHSGNSWGTWTGSSCAP